MYQEEEDDPYWKKITEDVARENKRVVLAEKRAMEARGFDEEAMRCSEEDDDDDDEEEEEEEEDDRVREDVRVEYYPQQQEDEVGPVREVATQTDSDFFEERARLRNLHGISMFHLGFVLQKKLRLPHGGGAGGEPPITYHYVGDLRAPRRSTETKATSVWEHYDCVVNHLEQIAPYEHIFRFLREHLQVLRLKDIMEVDQAMSFEEAFAKVGMADSFVELVHNEWSTKVCSTLESVVRTLWKEERYANSERWTRFFARFLDGAAPTVLNMRQAAFEEGIHFGSINKVIRRFNERQRVIVGAIIDDVQADKWKRNRNMPRNDDELIVLPALRYGAVWRKARKESKNVLAAQKTFEMIWNTILILRERWTQSWIRIDRPIPLTILARFLGASSRDILRVCRRVNDVTERQAILALMADHEQYDTDEAISFE